ILQMEDLPENVPPHEESTEAHRAQDAEQRQAAVRERTAFLSSHELRLSISGLIGALDGVLGDDAMTLPMVRQRLQQARQDVREMARLTDAILRVSRPDPSRISLVKAFFDAHYVARRVVERLEPLACKKGVALTNRIPEGMRVYGDAEWLSKMLESLTLDALRVTPGGKEVQLFQPRQDRVMVSVWDQGPGVDAEALKEIQASYEQPMEAGGDRADQKPERRPERGAAPDRFDPLFIAQVARAHGGRLILESRLGEGRVHTLVFPRVRPKVLVLDDEEMDRDLVMMFLSGLDVDAVETGTGEEALRRMVDDPPHLVISDITMPTMDGFQFLQATQENPALRDIPIILVTGDQKVEQRVRAFRLGAADFLVKPVLAQDLVSRVRRILG
ncbi:MAG: hybrid sensor histidine kinase/response regulator, partial [Magnetococcales bacterium]|nr:hybrid sensor histidine kinase/response regulator [Magnetococcales bacterium]